MFEKGNHYGGLRDPIGGKPSDRYRHLILRAIEEDKQIDILRKLAKGKKAGTKAEVKVSDQIRAIETMWDRALGKAEQTINANISEPRQPAERVDAALRSVEHFANGKGMDTKE